MDPNIPASPSEYITTNRTYPGLITPTRNIAVYVGEFEKGPVNEPVFISSALQFKQIFGRALDWNLNQWYQVHNFLLYASGIWVCRTAGESGLKSENNGNVASSTGEWGDIMSVFICDSIEYYSNIDTPYGPIKNVIKDGQVQKEYLVLIYRKDVLVEFFNVDDASEVESRYLESINLQGGHYKLANGLTDNPTLEEYSYSYSLFTKEDYEIDIIIGNDYCNELAIELAESRKDCVAYLGLPPRLFDFYLVNDALLRTESGDILIFGNVEISDMSQPTKLKILEYCSSLPKSEYAFFVCGFKVIENGFNNKREIVNIIGDIAGLKSLASTKNPWDSGIGLEKGRIKNFKNTKYYINKSDVNELYRNGINCLELDVLMSQKMFITREAVIDRLYLRNTMNYLKRASEKLIRKYVFELNIRDTRGKIASELKLLLDDIKLSNAIEAGKVIVKPDESSNGIIINIYIKFNYKAEFINIRTYNAGSNIIAEINTAK